ncbi:hypothetical protein Nepgr_017054 [Nepenthes gracilis]|uniref:Alpha/beta hydrolase fold-3 domain-containing protein n=1 Tax=Nepenthes gracilis TaxID=150966 RepID=A0AAD3SNR0_NEPGR|nr:hypothetical protein Nepgr_017054 [Nepenthes gracilis]
MASTAFDRTLGFEVGKDSNQHGDVLEEIQGLIKVYRDGHVERPLTMPCVAASLAPDFGVISQDIVIDKSFGIWARLYVPKSNETNKFPLLLYFHGGGFCVGSASWKCYHNFLGRLSGNAQCLIISVNYRLAPENQLPAAYEDGTNSLCWLQQQILRRKNESWLKNCNLSCIFLAGDSAGGNIAYNVATRLGNTTSKVINITGMILIQPFFTASDTYWRLALPPNANRDHPWCNPVWKGPTKVGVTGVGPIMICIAEMDILRDRNLEFFRALCSSGNMAENVVYKGVGHAFQVLDKSQLSETRTQEMISHIKAFISR